MKIGGRKGKPNLWEKKIIRGRELWFSEVIEDGTYLTAGEKLAVAVVAGGTQLFMERSITVDPTH